MPDAPAKPPKVSQYKVKCGKYYARNPEYGGTNPHDPAAKVMYKRGEIVSTDEDLEANFANAFEKVLEPQKKTVTEARKKAVYGLIELPKSMWTEDDREFLENVDDADFDRLVKKSQPKTLSEGVNKVTSVLGEDVTDTFGRAFDEGFKVFRNAAGKHQVTRGDSTKPLNPSPLDAKDVDKFVDRYLKENK
jgi:hypothetical protein